jgi:ATP phosphoribosyltransferase
MTTTQSVVKLALPKGRMQTNVAALLDEAGIKLRAGSRTYRPLVSLPNFEAKILKPQNIVEMIALGSRDLGFAGRDWVEELNAEVVELMDTGLDPVRIVAAAPPELYESLKFGKVPANRELVIATEYLELTSKWVSQRGVKARIVKTFGATEVFPPEDADLIVDNTASGATLVANDLHIVDELMRSSTRLFASPKAMSDPLRRRPIEDFVLLVSSVMEARKRVMVEVNVSNDQLETLVSILPCMREATISPLHNDAGYAVKAAVPSDQLPRLIPEIKARGGTGIIVTRIAQAVP